MKPDPPSRFSKTQKKWWEAGAISNWATEEKDFEEAVRLLGAFEFLLKVLIGGRYTNWGGGGGVWGGGGGGSS